VTNRERFLGCVHFEPVDRAPFWDFGYWTETPEVWREQGDFVTSGWPASQSL